VSEDLLDHRRILDAGNDPDGATSRASAHKISVWQ
jgi:hypothetical protein